MSYPALLWFVTSHSFLGLVEAVLHFNFVPIFFFLGTNLAVLHILCIHFLLSS